MNQFRRKEVKTMPVSSSKQYTNNGADHNSDVTSPEIPFGGQTIKSRLPSPKNKGSNKISEKSPEKRKIPVIEMESSNNESEQSKKPIATGMKKRQLIQEDDSDDDEFGFNRKKSKRKRRNSEDEDDDNPFSRKSIKKEKQVHNSEIQIDKFESVVLDTEADVDNVAVMDTETENTMAKSRSHSKPSTSNERSRSHPVIKEEPLTPASKPRTSSPHRSRPSSPQMTRSSSPQMTRSASPQRSRTSSPHRPRETNTRLRPEADEVSQRQVCHLSLST